MKYYLTQAGVNFIQEGKAENKAKKRKWLQALGRKRVEAGKGGTERTVTAHMTGTEHGQKVGAAAVAAGREGRSRQDKSFIGLKRPEGGAVAEVARRRKARREAEDKK